MKSELRDFQPEMLKKLLPMKKDGWYDAKLVEDTVESLSETAGLLGYAFADINPEFRRDAETRTMAITFNVAESPRTYVERIDVNGNTLMRKTCGSSMSSSPAFVSGCSSAKARSTSGSRVPLRSSIAR